MGPEETLKRIYQGTIHSQECVGEMFGETIIPMDNIWISLWEEYDRTPMHERMILTDSIFDEQYIVLRDTRRLIVGFDTQGTIFRSRTIAPGFAPCARYAHIRTRSEYFRSISPTT